jgi:hypothetical protein
MGRVLRGLFELQPPGEGVAKFIAQIDNLSPQYRIGTTRLQSDLNASSIISKSNLLNSRFSTTAPLTLLNGRKINPELCGIESACGMMRQ